MPRNKNGGLSFSGYIKQPQHQFAISKIPCVLYHRGGGYLCRDPKPTKRNCAAIAFDENVIPSQKFYIVPRDNNNNLSSSTMEPLIVLSTPNQNLIRTRQEYYKELQKLIGKEVAIQDASTGAYLTSKGGRKVSLKDSIHKSQFKTGAAQSFYLHRTNTGAYTFKTVADSRNDHDNLYMHRSHITKDQTMEGSQGGVMTIQKCSINFSNKVNGTGEVNHWVIEPNITLGSALTTDYRNSPGYILFLGIVDVSPIISKHIKISWHSYDAPPAWRSKEDWKDAIDSLTSQHCEQRNTIHGTDDINESFYTYTDYQGNQARWVAKCAGDGKMYIVITSVNFSQEVAQKCAERMIFMENPLESKLQELGLEMCMEEPNVSNRSNSVFRKKNTKEQNLSKATPSGKYANASIPMLLCPSNSDTDESSLSSVEDTEGGRLTSTDFGYKNAHGNDLRLSDIQVLQAILLANKASQSGKDDFKTADLCYEDIDKVALPDLEIEFLNAEGEFQTVKIPKNRNNKVRLSVQGLFTRIKKQPCIEACEILKGCPQSKCELRRVMK